MPIAIWVLSCSNKIVIQGKMGHSFIFSYSLSEPYIKLVQRFGTSVCGFCRMRRINGNSLIGVSE
jgi:hypothetical protein